MVSTFIIGFIDTVTKHPLDWNLLLQNGRKQVMTYVSRDD